MYQKFFEELLAVLKRPENAALDASDLRIQLVLNFVPDPVGAHWLVALAEHLRVNRMTVRFVRLEQTWPWSRFYRSHISIPLFFSFFRSFVVIRENILYSYKPNTYVYMYLYSTCAKRGDARGDLRADAMRAARDGAGGPVRLGVRVRVGSRNGGVHRRPLARAVPARDRRRERDAQVHTKAMQTLQVQRLSVQSAGRIECWWPRKYHVLITNLLFIIHSKSIELLYEVYSH